MAETYQTIINSTARDLSSWDGAGVGQDGCSAPTSYNLSSYSGGTPVSGQTRSYEPHLTVTRRYPTGKQRGWGRAQRAGLVKMSDYSHSTVETTNSLVGVDKLGESVYGRLCKKLGTHKEAGSCKTYCVNKEAQYSYHSWTEQGDLAYWQDQGLPILTYSGVNDSELLDAVRSTRESAAVKSYRDYDALTELFEFPETCRMFCDTQNRFLNSFRRFVTKHGAENVSKFWIPTDILFGTGRAKLKAFLLKNNLRFMARHYSRRLGRALPSLFKSVTGAWMQYRYGIMPLVYSFNDILKLQHRTQYVTDKSTSYNVGISTYSPSEPSPKRYIRKDVTGSIRVTSTVTCSYRSSRLAQLSRLGLNPIATAWELLPYSFVVDWFINAGDYIAANMSMNFASHTGACTAIKRNLTTTYTLYYENNQTLTRNMSVSAPGTVCWPTGTYPWELTYSSLGQGVLREVSEDSYVRSTFARAGAVQLRVNPYLNWKRYLDGGILATNQLRALARSLRK